MRIFILVFALGAAALLPGCVTRRMLITSEPTGAVVFLDGKLIGATPVDVDFIYYGKYHLRLIKDGFEPMDVEPELAAPVYQWIGLDLIAENFIPFTFRDTQHLHYALQRVIPPRPEDVKASGEALRAVGKGIGAPAGFAQPRRSNKDTPAPVSGDH